LRDYFCDLLETHSWSSVKLDLYGLKFFYAHVLRKPWVEVDLVKPPRGQRLPDIVTVEEVARLVQSTRVLSYRVLFFTLYSLGLRLGEGLRLTVADIDAERGRVHIRDSKGNKDRLVPLPDATLGLLRRFWQIHRHPRLLFPNRKAGLKGALRVNLTADTRLLDSCIKNPRASRGDTKRERVQRSPDRAEAGAPHPATVLCSREATPAGGG
jgi:integrase